MPTVISITPSLNDTLYQDSAGQLSNGAGQRFYVGDTNQPAGSIRRGIIEFNLSAIPAGSIVQSATLTLHMSMTRPGSGPEGVSLHPALKAWGEGNSNAAIGSPGAGEGAGAQATAGDVTWLFTFYNSQRWTTPGGDFGAASAATSVDAVGFYQWTGPGVTADVQRWVNHPSANFGWILIGEEISGGDAKQFDSRNNNAAANRPVLTVDYTSGTSTPVVDLTIHKSHIGTFTAGGTGTYTISVGNAGTAATTAAVSVSDVLPGSLVYAGPASVNGWTISVNQQTITATRSDRLAAGANYPALVIQVKIASNAPPSVINTATVSGGGDADTGDDTAADVTPIIGMSQFRRRRGA